MADAMYFAKEHEWVKVSGDIGTVGITDHAQKLLKDVVYVELPKAGAKEQAGRPMCVIESVKSVSDVYAPLSGEVVEVNRELEANPDLVNRDNYGSGWIARIRISNMGEIKELLTKEQYDEFVKDK